MKQSSVFTRRVLASAIGRDGLVFLVNKNNPVGSLTREQLVDIYTGKVTDWSQISDDNGKITAFQRNETSGSQTMFLKLLMKDVEPMNPPSELVPAMMGALIDGVAAYDGTGGAIGYSVYYYASLMYQNPDIKLIDVDGVAPSNEAIADGSYPLTNEFYAVIRKDLPVDSPARKLRDYLLTADGKKLIEDAGYVALTGEKSSSLRVTHTEEDVPKNTPENQAYVDKYMNPFSITGLFRLNFGPGGYAELNGRLMTIFNAFYNHDYPDSDLHLTDMDTDVPQDILEDTLMAHLGLTQEQIRKDCAEYYNAEKQVYTADFGLGGGPSEFVVTGSNLGNGVLSLSYDFYGGDRENTTDTFRYVLLEHGQLQIEIDGDNYKFLSNAVLKAVGID